MLLCLLDPNLGLKDGDHSPRYVGRMIGDLFHHQGVPIARRMGDRTLVKFTPHGMDTGQYPGAVPAPVYRVSKDIYVGVDRVIFVDRLDYPGVGEAVRGYEAALTQFLQDCVAGVHGRTVFARDWSLQMWISFMISNRQRSGLPELTRAEWQERFAAAVGTRIFMHPTYSVLNWNTILP